MMKRRTLIKLAASTVAVLPFRRMRLWAQVTELPDESVATLRDLAAVVLPQSLGRDKTDALAESFAEWVRDYRPGVPLRPGYGHPRVRVTPPSPAATYIAQLAELEKTARAQGRTFGKLESDAQRALVESALSNAKVEDLPRRPSGQHVVADLMSFYFHSSEANDYCYGVYIGRHKCKPLAVSTQRPEPL
jgi:hypothetical protein